jgi:hypothetical protein
MSDAKRDRFGRYLLTHPETGKEQAWTRATTFADALEDSYGLTKWKQRGTAVGIGMRSDLLSLAQALTMDDKKGLDDVCEQALTVASANERSNLGTALHKMTERLDRGEDFAVPVNHQPDMSAYLRIKAQNDMQTRPDYIERITVIPEFDVAGTMDRIVRLDGAVRIADLKTGQDLTRGWGKIAVQLALYSRGAGLWNEQAGTWEPMPPVEQDWGVVIHLPAGSGSAALWKVDLNAGWEAAHVCRWVREWRKRKGLAEQISSPVSVN